MKMVTRPRPRAVVGLAVAVTVAMGVVGCSAWVEAPTPSTPPATRTEPVVPEPAPSPTPSPTPTTVFPAGPVLPEVTDTPQDVLAGLMTPWSIAFLPGGSALISLRDPAQVVWFTAAGAIPLSGPGASDLARTTVHNGEGGLLGLAVSPDVEQDHLVYIYRTTAQGNEVVRATLTPDTGELGHLQVVVGGIPSESYHNGGRIAFGPDGMLYVATGDAGLSGESQDPSSPSGKILRVTPDGEVPPDNPFEGNPVWTYGHRNVQGLGWDASGRMLASEFGQDTWDELNVITPGANYGWPTVEGTGAVEGLVDPVAVWGTDDASPSGIAVTDAGVYLAALRGERLWWVPFDGDGFGQPSALLVGTLGRLRDVVVGPDGALWILTNNTDGRGTPRDADDRIVRIALP